LAREKPILTLSRKGFELTGEERGGEGGSREESSIFLSANKWKWRSQDRGEDASSEEQNKEKTNREYGTACSKAHPGMGGVREHLRQRGKNKKVSPYDLWRETTIGGGEGTLKSC